MNLKLIEDWIDKQPRCGREKFAAAADIGMGKLQRMLNHRATPDIDEARRMATVLGVSLDELCGSDLETRATG